MVELIVMAVVAAASAYSSAKQQSAAGRNRYLVGLNNANMTKNETELAIGMQRLRNEQGFDDAKYNFQLAELNAKARTRNADRLRLYAEAKTKEGRQMIRRQKRSFEQFTGKQEAAIGASGISFSGSALDVLAESAGQMQIAIQDAATQINLQRDDNLNRANDERFGAALDTSRARAGMASAQRTYDLNEGASKLGVLSASSQYSASQFAAAKGFETALMGANNTRTQAAIQIGASFAGAGFGGGSGTGFGGGSNTQTRQAPSVTAYPVGGGGYGSSNIFRYNAIE